MNLFWIAVGLMMIFEGIPLACFPEQVRDLARKVPELENGVLRFLGIVSMLIGLGIVYFGKVVLSND